MLGRLNLDLHLLEGEQESHDRRQFAELVDELPNHAPKFSLGSEELTKTFQQWLDMGTGFGALSAKAPVLSNGSGRVLELQKMGSAGLEALNYLRTGTAPSGSWKETQLELLKQAETPDVSWLRLPWLGSYRELILAAADVGSLRKMDRKEWKQRVLNEAAKLEPAQKYSGECRIQLPVTGPRLRAVAHK